MRSGEINGVTGCETAYYLLSTPLSSTRFAEVARAHRVLDVTMNEDQTERGWTTPR